MGWDGCSTVKEGALWWRVGGALSGVCRMFPGAGCTLMGWGTEGALRGMRVVHFRVPGWDATGHKFG